MNKRGLSLLEIVVASVILAVVMTGLAGVFVGGKRWVLHFRSRSTAAELVKKFLDFLPGQVRQDQWSTNELGKRAIANRTNGTSDGLDRNYMANYTASDAPIANLTKVKTEIKWTEPSL